jgi:inorganic pyrophosphatase
MHHSLSIGDKAPEVVDVMIEVPAGERNKYEYDKDTGVLRLDRVIYSPFVYPGDYGFIPETLGDDGDPLDVLVITDSPVFPGCVLAVRPIGVFYMSDDKGGDEKIIAVPVKHPRFTHVNTLEDISAHIPKEISHFFEQYKKLENKAVEVKGFGDKAAALALITKAQEAHKA